MIIQQTQQKVKLVQGDYKRFKGVSNQKKIIIKIKNSKQ